MTKGKKEQGTPLATPEGESGYVNYFEILGLDEDAKPGEVRKVYRRQMKELVGEIARVEITQERRAHYLLERATLNAGLCLLRDQGSRDRYWRERNELIDLELTALSERALTVE